MRITQVEFRPVSMKLAQPYTIAYETVDTCTNVFLRLVTDSEHVGLGCAAPDLEVTGETAESALSACRDFVEPALHGADALRIALHLNVLRPDLARQPSVLAMVDMALYDLLGKVAELPVYMLLGGFRRSMATSVTLGIMAPARAVEQVQDWLKRGVHIFKLKGGRDVEADIAVVRSVREAIGAKGEIRFDANQGYTTEEAVHFVNETRAARVQILEQPTPRHRSDLLGQVSRDVSIPVMADESLMSLTDVLNLAASDQTDMINIKLQKVGGLFEAGRINAVAHAAGYEAMVGCMDEAALSIAAGLHFALARPNVQYADLDGHLDLVDDPSSGSVEFRDGVLYPNDAPGLGARLADLD